MSNDYRAIGGKKEEGQGETVQSVSWVDEPLFLNRGAIATPKSRPSRTWVGAIGTLSFVQSRDAGGPSHFAYTHVVRTHGCVPDTKRESTDTHAGRPVRESRTKTNPHPDHPSSRSSHHRSRQILFLNNDDEIRYVRVIRKDTEI